MLPGEASQPIRLRLTAASARLAVCRLDPTAPVPAWATAGTWWSVCRTQGELSIVCEAQLVPQGTAQSGPWRALMVRGPLPLALVGILDALASPLAGAHIPIFAVSTHDTDWVLVPEERLAQARATLTAAGHQVAP